MTMTNVTIGFVPRDRFCKAPESLARLLEVTDVPYRLVVVDPGIPAIFREPMERLLQGRDNVTILPAVGSLTSNGARNLVLERADTEFVCLIENDCIVEPGWLTHLIRACEEHPADAAAPLLLEPRGSANKVHFDDRLGSIRRIEDTGKLEILPRSTSLETDRAASRRPTDFVEMHCLLFRRSVFDRIGLFDETQHGSRAEVDLSLALWVEGVPTVLEPLSRVTFSAPPPVYPEERDYYLRYWDIDASNNDHRVIEERWNLVTCPSAIGFATARQRLVEEPDPNAQLQRHLNELATIDQAAADLARVIPEHERLILVDEAQWVAGDVAGDRPTVPFTEREGEYWGPPADDGNAISELERLRKSGASYVVVGWPAFWWLQHYKGFNDYLRSTFSCLLENERLVIFDLRQA